MNKKETADALGITTRTLERHMSAGRVAYDMRKGKTGEAAFFEPAEVERFRTELNTPTIPGKVQEATQALATTSHVEARQLVARREGQQLAALMASGVREAMREIVSELSISESLPPAPSVWLTIEQAAEWLGLPRNAVQRALHDDRDGTGQQRRIKALGAGRGLRLHAASIRAYFEG
jgi:predicted DNA-binding protein (UPF0251 family)